MSKKTTDKKDDTSEDVENKEPVVETAEPKTDEAPKTDSAPKAEEVTVAPEVKEEAPAEVIEPKIERWWFDRGSEFALAARLKSTDKVPVTVKFSNSVLDVDVVATPQLAKDLRGAMGYGSDLHVIVDKDDETDEGKACSDAFMKCITEVVDGDPNRGLRRVAAILTIEECEKFDIDPLHPEKHKLMNTLFTNKSFAPIEQV